MSSRTSLLLLVVSLGVATISSRPLRAADSATVGQTMVTGTITNSGTGRTLEGARVVLAGTGRETVTDITGTYRFDNVPAGSVVLSVSYTGLNTQDIPLEVSAGGVNRKDVGLTADIYTMSKFVVASEREGNAQAVTLQRLSSGVKNIVSSDAFGGLAGNPADLAVRLPGVEGESVGGDFRYIRIRGLNQNLSTITQDGNRLADAASAGATREFQFQTVGSDSIERIEVVKSPTPDMDGDSIGGNVNLVSKSAFDSSGDRRISGSIGTIWRPFSAHGNRTKPRPSYSFAYSEVFAKKFAVALNLGWRMHDVVSSANSFGREQLAPGVQGPAYTYSVAPSDGTFSRTREGGGLRLDYKLSESTRFYATFTYNKHLEHGFDVGNGTSATWQTGQAVATRDAAGNFTGTGGIIPGYTDQMTAIRAVASSQITVNSGEAFKEGETANLQIGAIHRYKDLNIDYDAYQSKSKSNYANNTSLSYTLSNIGFTFNNTDTSHPGVVQTAGPDWSDVNNYNSNSYTKTRMAGWDQYEGAQINVKKDLATVVPTYLKAGVRLRTQIRDLRNTTYRTAYVGPDGVMGLNPATGKNDDNLAQFGFAGRPWPNNIALGGYPNNLPIPAVEGKQTMILEETLAKFPQYFRENIAADIQGELTGDQRFKESINGYYLMGNVDLGKISIMGGVRVETTKTEGEGALQLVTPAEKARRAAYVGTVTDEETRRRNLEEYGRRQTLTGDYRTVFPGLHFKYQPLAKLVARLSYATNIGRPGIGQLIPRTTANLDNQTLTTSNPSLKPQSANNFDLAVEYYFEPAGVVSAGVFYKELKDFIYTAGGVTVPAGADNGFNGDYAGFVMTTQYNGGFAKIKGLELNYNQQFTFLPGLFNGLGAFANLTRMQTEGNYGAGSAISLAPTSKVAGFNPFIANLGVSYIRDKVSIRFQYNIRGRYLSTFNTNESRQIYKDESKTLDIKTVYHFSRHFDVYLDVVNITKTPDRKFVFGVGDRWSSIGYLPPQVLLGVNGRL